MKITRLETFFVKPRFIFLKIHTDEGICGWGEPTLEGRIQTIAATIGEYEKYLIGQDPTRVEHLWQTLYRSDFYRGGPIACSAISGIEQALWDITGKAYGQPVYKLLGGAVRDKIRMYSGCSNDPEMAKEKVARGFTALKAAPDGPALPIESTKHIDKMVQEFAALRDAIGYEIDLAIDFHGRYSPAAAKQLIKEIEYLRPYFIEEPVLPEYTEALKNISEFTHIPIATGERLFSKWDFKQLLVDGSTAVWQPDLSHAGGILECKKIAAMAECNFASIAPHCPLGPVALAACFQLDACTPNFLIQEHFTLGDGFIKEPFVLDEDGYVPLPDKPGLGVDVDEDYLKANAFDGDWECPRYFHEDGSIADW